MLLMGMATLAMWNGHLKSIPFTQSSSSSVYITPVFSGMNLMTNLVLVSVSGLGYKRMIMAGLMGSIAMAVAAALMLTHPSPYPRLAIVGLTGMFSAMFQSGCYAMLSHMAVTVGPCFLAGQAAVGLVISGVAVIAVYLSISNPVWLIFGACLVILVSALLSYSFLLGCVESDPVTVNLVGEKAMLPDSETTKKANKKLKLFPCAMIWLNFAVTMTWFPLAIVRFSKGDGKFALLAFSLFDIGDILGRLAPVMFSVYHDVLVWAVPICRLFLFGLLFSFAILIPIAPVWMHAIIFAFAISSGLGNSVIVLWTVKKRVDTGKLLSMSLVSGIVTGSLLSLLIGKFVLLK